MYIDTHSHLNFKVFNADYKDAILRANSVGVEKIIVVGSNLKTSKKALEIANKNENIFVAIGLHPIHVENEDFGLEFEKLAKNKKVVAIGETGLDYFHIRDNKEKQKDVFIKHLKLAQNVNKPVILHNRDAGDDILSILTSQNTLPKGVMHCFSENLEFAKIIIDMGFLISFTGIITFTKNQDTLQVVKEIPLEKIMIETDCPYLTPNKYRGKRNEPAYVVEVAKKIAEIKKISLEKVEDITSKNAIELFKLF